MKKDPFYETHFFNQLSLIPAVKYLYYFANWPANQDEDISRKADAFLQEINGDIR